MAEEILKLSADVTQFVSALDRATKSLTDFNAAGLQAVLAANKLNFPAAASGTQQLSQQLSTLGNQTGRVTTLFNTAGAAGVSFAGNMSIATAAVAALGAAFATLPQTIALDKSLAEIGTIAQQINVPLSEISNNVRGVATQFGLTNAEVAAAAYQGLSNSVITSRESFQFLNDQAALARVGQTSLANAIDATSSVLNSYGLSLERTTSINAQLFESVRLGRFRFSEIANTIGRVTPLAAELNIPLNDLLGALSTITQRGVRASEALTQVSGVFRALLAAREGSALGDEIRTATGFASGADLVRTEGLIGTLRVLADLGQRSSGEISRLLPNVRSLIGALNLGAGSRGTEQFRAVSESILNSTESFRQAQEIIQSTPGVRVEQEFQRVKNAIENTLGTALVKIFDDLNTQSGGFARSLQSSLDVLKGILEVGGSIAGALGTGFGAVIRGLEKIESVFPIFEGFRNAIKGIFDGISALGGGSNIDAQTELVRRLADSERAVRERQDRDAEASSRAFDQRLQETTTAFGRAFATINQQLVTARESLRLGLEASADALSGAARNVTRDAEERVRKAQQDVSRLESLIRRADVRAETARAVAVPELPTASLIRGQAERITPVSQETARFISEQGIQGVQIRGGDNRPAFFERDLEVATRVRALRDQSNSLQTQINELEANIGRNRTQTDAVSVQQVQNDLETLRRLITEQRNINVQVQTAIRQRTIERGLTPGTSFVDTGTGAAQAAEVNALQGILNGLNDRIQQARATGNAEEVARLTQQIALVRQQQAQIALPANQPQGANTREAVELRIQRIVQETARIQAEAARAALQAAREREREAEARQNALTRSVQAVTRFDFLTSSGNLAERFRQQAGAQLPNAGIRRQTEAAGTAALAEFDRLSDQTIQRAREAGASNESINNLILQLGQQRVQIVRQIEQAVTQTIVSQTQQRANAERDAIRQAEREGADLRRQGQTGVSQQTDQIVRALTTALDALRAAPGPRPAIPALGVPLDPAARAALEQRQQQIQQAATARNAAIQAVQDAITANDRVRRASGDQERIAGLGALDEAVRRARTAFEEFQRLSQALGNNTQETAAGRAAAQEALRRAGVNAPLPPQGGEAIIQRLLEGLNTAVGQINQGNARTQEAETRRTELNTLITELGVNVGGINNNAAALDANLNNAGQAVQTFGQAVQDVAARLNQIAVPAPAGAPAVGRAMGGLIGTSFNTNGPDNVLAYLRTGEFVVNAESTRAFYPLLRAINASNSVPRFASGGVASQHTGDITINVNESNNPQTTAREILSLIKREQRLRG